MTDAAAATAPAIAAAPAETASTRPWVEKHRPASLDGVIAHEDILSTLRRLMASNSLPHLLFYGPPGTGKTTTIQACARHIFGQARIKGSVLELNASDDRGIDVIRHEIKDFASTGQVLFGGGGNSMKLVILDEADQMSHDAQAALRRVIEKFTKNVRFCIICNHVNKIIPAVQSRCTRFRFGPVKKAAMIGRLAEIATAENVPFDDKGLQAAIKLSAGDMRRCLNIMQAAALSMKAITEQTVFQSTGNPTPDDVRAILETCLSANFADAWASVSERMHLLGLSTVDLVREIHAMLQRMDLPSEAKCFCFVQLADVEYNLNAGTSEAVALAATLGVMQLVRESISHRKALKDMVPDLLPLPAGQF
uniref:AAA+ ATPase domain-containing protein n=1 Tax=Neobodo designis TaxID=312471 RepID=A0A7S1QZI5_NEODS|eukprot:CAMPEP_0174877448 /NCGR_PEP_ID=MMETSP1114-20130205/81858_1 /TAXON_ID=312471 /ORGANISM="Neobodo designis, Strain CCAP 1951/1" /LENGTH=364 /DNA_ID=CAMNT_0016112827 /DNA_START=21 /DNA_END=1115 /DNA_ORIENTATION=+